MSQTQINRLLPVVVLFSLCAMIGCHRGYYRRQANAEARRLILEKANDPRWNSSDGNIDIDPQSRMFDPFSADHPPIPPDDPASHQFMRVVDGKKGYPHWHANGDTNYVENPVWRSYLPVDENGRVVLTLERAFQLALVNSPELQQQRETLYLSALDVSLERFGFDTQMFAGFNNFFSTKGRFRDGSGVSRSENEFQLGVDGGGINFERLGITGSTFAVGLANTILFNFAGNDTQSATSLIDFSIIQPLLRGAGRDRIMESLTQAERTLLANVRQLARFRRGFYLAIAIGRGSTAGLNRGGTFLGVPESATLNAGGFFGLLEQQQRIRNQELNVRQLEAVLRLFDEFFERDRLDAVQLKLFESSVYRQQRDLLDLNNSYQTSLDRFKLDLGLPPDIDVVIDDRYLDQFELISDQINERIISISRLREETGTAHNKVDDLFDELQTVDDLGTEKFKWPTEVSQLISQLVPYLDQAEDTLDKIFEEDRRELEADFRELESKLVERETYLKNLKEAIEAGRIPSTVDPGLFELDEYQSASKLREILSDPNSTESIVNRITNVNSELQSIKSKIKDFSQTEGKLSRKQAYAFIVNEIQGRIPGQLSEMNNLALEMSLLQARARSNSIQLAEVDIESEQSIEIARCMRRDWMNARASLVDNFRNIEFVADELESQFDLVFEGDIGNTGDNPFKLRYETGQLRGGIRFDAPIVRIAERNEYREALIEYQQSRRQYYQFEDNVKRNLRDIVRNLNRNKVLFELDRRTVQVGIENVEINRYELERPVGPGATSSRLGATTAQNLANAIIGLNNAQNSFVGSWVEFEVLRRSLDFDMGTMQLDAGNQWIDPVKIDASIGYRAASMMGIELNCQFCQGAASPLATSQSTGLEPLGSPVPPSQVPDRLDTHPQQLPESESVIEPTVPVEIQERGTPSSPQLNEPETGINRQFPNSKIPNLLFNQVRVPALPHQESQRSSKRTIAAKTTATDSLKTGQDILSPKDPFVTLAETSKPVESQVLPFSRAHSFAFGESLYDSNQRSSVFSTNQTEQLLSKPALKRVSLIAEVEEAENRTQSEGLETSVDEPAILIFAHDPLLKATAPLSASVLTLKATTGHIPPVPAIKQKSKLSTGQTRTDRHTAPGWQFQGMSLDGALSRFRTSTRETARD